MKIVNSPKVIITEDDLKKLLVRFIEKKTGKKVSVVELGTSVDPNGVAAVAILNEEETDLEEPKNA